MPVDQTWGASACQPSWGSGSSFQQVAVDLLTDAGNRGPDRLDGFAQCSGIVLGAGAVELIGDLVPSDRCREG